MFARCHLYHLFRTFLCICSCFLCPEFWRAEDQCFVDATRASDVNVRLPKWRCEEEQKVQKISGCRMCVSFVYICGLCFFTPGWLLRRHLLNIPCFCVARSPDWGRLLLWDHHLHAVQRKEAMTLAEMFEMLMKMRAKAHIMKRTLMWPRHFVCLALTIPNMCKRDRRMFFFSGFLTVCESTHPEKIWVVIWFIELNLSQFIAVLTGSLLKQDQQKHQNTIKYLDFSATLSNTSILPLTFRQKSYPRRWRIQAFPEIRHHFNVRNPRIPYHPWDRTVYIYLTTWKPPQKVNRFMDR